MNDANKLTREIVTLLREHQVHDYYFAIKDPDSSKVRMCKSDGVEWVHGSLATFTMLTTAEMKMSVRRATGMDT